MMLLAYFLEPYLMSPFTDGDQAMAITEVFFMFVLGRHGHDLSAFKYLSS